MCVLLSIKTHSYLFLTCNRILSVKINLIVYGIALTEILEITFKESFNYTESSNAKSCISIDKKSDIIYEQISSEPKSYLVTSLFPLLLWLHYLSHTAISCTHNPILD